MEKKIPKYPNLVAEMVKNGDTQISLGKVIGLAKTTMCLKMSGKTEWTMSEIDKICEYYKKNYYELFK